MENSTEMNVNDVNAVVEGGEQTDVVDQASHNSDFDLIETEKTEEKADDGQGEVVDTHRQTRADNRAAKQARIKAEREAKAKVDEYEKAIREIENPYTDKPFESFEEFKEYGKKVRDARLKEKAEESGKTVEEIAEEEEALRDYRKKKAEESEAQQKQKEEETSRNFFEEDLRDFLEEYPDVDVAKLDNNPSFRKFCGSRYGKEPLADLYADFVSIVGDAQKAGQAKRDTRNDRSTGSGSNGGERLTSAQQKSLDDWNRKNPDMKMTAKEYLSM